MLEDIVHKILERKDLFRHQLPAVIVHEVLCYLSSEYGFLDTREVSRLYRFKEKKLREDRSGNIGIPYYKFGDKKNSRVGYRIREIEEYIAQCHRVPT